MGIYRFAAVVMVVGGACVPATSASALVPSSGATEPNGVSITSPCSLTNKSTHDVAKTWVLYTLDPRRKHSSKSGVELAAEKMPRPPEFPVEAITGYIPVSEGVAFPKESGGCTATGVPFESEAKGEEVSLTTPGPYILEQVEAKVEWQIGPGGTSPQKCGGNDKFYPQPATSTLEHPEQQPPLNEVWEDVSFCNTVNIIQFNVRGGEGECPVVQDMSKWPQVGYFNQYATGKRLGLPQASDGNEGGNACGPSSLLMAMRMNMIRYGLLRGKTPEQVGQTIAALPDLLSVFDNVMKLSSSEQEPTEENYFDGGERPVPWLRSQGWSEAEFVGLGSGSLSNNQDKIIKALDQGPIIISTAFGGGRWGKTGGGHIIMINGPDREHPGEVDVYDPAGNYFASPTKHYNSKSCGYNVPYPLSWLLVYTDGRYFIKLGQPPQSDPPVISVSDSEPGSAGAPETFYLEDPGGQKSGWIAGQQLSEIPGSFTGQLEENSYSDPNAGFEEESEEFTLLAPLGPGPRTIDLANPPAGTTLHVKDAGGGSYALQSDDWSGGQRVLQERLSGTAAPGADTTVSSSALTSASQESNGGPNPTKNETPSGSASSGSSAGTSGTQPSSGQPPAGHSPVVTTHLTRAQKLAKALKACKKLKKAKRKACQAQARKRYGPKPKKPKKKR
jgi:hypothetical protein